MSNCYLKYIYQDWVTSPDYKVHAYRSIKNNELHVCVFPSSDEDYYVEIPVLDMVDNLIADFADPGSYEDQARICLTHLIRQIEKRLKKGKSKVHPIKITPNRSTPQRLMDHYVEGQRTCF